MKKFCFTGGLLLLLLISAAPVIFSQSKPGASSIVITFDPPLHDGLNRSADLFAFIVETMNSHPELASAANDIGAVWTASHNLSGVQFSLFSPDSATRAQQISSHLLEKLGSFSPPKPASAAHEFASYLHHICHINTDITASATMPITVYLEGDGIDPGEELALAASKTAMIYSYTLPSISSTSPVLEMVKPTLFEVFSWNRADHAAFFSAKYIGEQFARETAAISSASYEIIFSRQGLKLILIVSGRESDLFQARELLQSFNQKAQNKPDKTQWQNYVRTAASLLTEDSRDIGKSAMSSAWLRHWHCIQHTDEDWSYVPPHRQCSNSCMPQSWMHDFSYSHEVFPGFAACSISENPDLADISIVIAVNEPRILDSIVETLENRGTLSFPYSISRNDNRIVLSFFSMTSEVSGNIARLRAKILNSLVEKGFISDLPGPLKIGISGVCRLPAFIMRGMLQNGWPPIKTGLKWQQAESTQIAELFNLKVSPPDAAVKRWNLLTSSAKGKAEILAFLAAGSLMIHSFEDFKGF
jgi:hypothetical protein